MHSLLLGLLLVVSSKPSSACSSRAIFSALRHRTGKMLWWGQHETAMESVSCGVLLVLPG